MEQVKFYQKLNLSYTFTLFDTVVIFLCSAMNGCLGTLLVQPKDLKDESWGPVFNVFGVCSGGGFDNLNMMVPMFQYWTSRHTAHDQYMHLGEFYKLCRDRIYGRKLRLGMFLVDWSWPLIMGGLLTFNAMEPRYVMVLCNNPIV